MDEADEVFSYWNDHPPTHVLLKSLLEGLGGKPSSSPSRRSQSSSSSANHPMSVAMIPGMASAPPEIEAKFAELRRLGAEKLAEMGRTLN